MKKLLPVLLFVTPGLHSFDTAPIPQRGTVTGKVITGLNEGVRDAYIYVIAGEEETLSVKGGNFTLKTWQPLPVVLVIEHADYEKEVLTIKDAGAPLVIKLSDRKD